MSAPRWWRAVEHPATPWVLVCVAVLLASPAFRVGLLFEDWGQRMLLAGDAFDPLAMFRVARDPAELAQARDIGLAPWWSDPELRLAFFRPLSVLTHRLDWRLWPTHPWVCVAHTFAWWALAAFAAWRAYLRLLPSRGAAVLATFAWAADDARGTAVGWLANRNTLVASAFGLGAVALHLRARDGGGWAARAAAVALLAAALLSGEAGVGAVLWLVALAACLEPDRRRAAGALAPYALAVVPWLLVWKGLGFGAANSGAYVDPVTDPGRWTLALLERGPVDWAAQWVGPVATAASMTATPLRLAWLAPAVAVCGGVLAWAWPLVRTDARAAASLLGSLLALLPVVSVFPSERVLAFVGFGAAALLGRGLHELAHPPAVAARPWRLATWALAGLALAVGPAGLPLAIDANRAVISLSTAPWDRWPSAGDDLTGLDVVSLTAPCSMCSGYLIPYRLATGRSAPARWRVVAPAWDRVTVVRTGPRALEVSTAHGFAPAPGAASEWFGPIGPHVLAQQLDATFQSWRRPFPPGAVVDVGVFRVTVLSVTDDGRPLRVRLDFERSLDDPALRLVRFSGDRMEDVAAPAVGASVTFAPEPVPFAPPPREDGAR